MILLTYILIGIFAGISGGLFGIGGGIVVVPCMIYFLGFSQKKAQGTSLVALLAPVGILAVYEYWKAGNVEVAAGLWIAAGFVVGSVGGSKLAVSIDENLLRKLFAGFLVLIAINLFLKK